VKTGQRGHRSIASNAAKHYRPCAACRVMITAHIMREADAVRDPATMEAIATHYALLAERRVTFKSSVPSGRPPASIRKALMRVRNQPV